MAIGAALRPILDIFLFLVMTGTATDLVFRHMLLVPPPVGHWHGMVAGDTGTLVILKINDMAVAEFFINLDTVTFATGRDLELLAGLPAFIQGNGHGACGWLCGLCGRKFAGVVTDHTVDAGLHMFGMVENDRSAGIGQEHPNRGIGFFRWPEIAKQGNKCQDQAKQANWPVTSGQDLLLGKIGKNSPQLWGL